MAEAGRLRRGLVGEAGAVAAPLVAAVRADDQPDALLALAAQAHLRLHEVLADPSTLVDVATRLAVASAPLADLVDGDLPDPAEVAELAAAVRATTAALGELDELATLPDAEPVAQMGRRLLDHLVASHLRSDHPLGYWTLRLVGVLRGDPELEPVRLDVDAVPQLLRDPEGVLREAYGWGTGDADVYAFLVNLQQVLTHVGIPSRFTYPGADEAAALGTDPGAPRPDRHLRILALVLPADPLPALVGLSILPLTPADGADRPDRDGIAVVPFGTSAVGERRELSAGWTAGFRASADAAARYGFVVHPGSAGLAALDGGEVPQDLRVEAVLESTNRPEEPTFVVGEPDGSRLEIGQMGLRVTAAMGDDPELVVAFPLLGCRAVVDAGGMDGFVATVLGGVTGAGFDLTPAWSSRHGLHLEGSADLSSTMAAHEAAGPVQVREVRVAARPVDGGVVATATLTARARLGPFTATIEGAGVQLRVSLPGDRGGRLGLLDAGLETVPPTGVGVHLDAGPVTGGGHLTFDPAAQRYVGAVQLDVEGVAMNAVGVVTTDVPDDGYALLVAVSSDDFPPVRLGLGFTLQGVGGLVGLDRGVAVDALRSGLRDGGLDAVLFPEDPVGSIDTVVRDLGRVFPATPGRHLVGPAAVIGWGTPTVLTMDLALLLELPDPVRLLALGQLRARLPSPERPVAVLNMDAVGVVDFDDGSASLDATLYDSHIAGHTLSGDMALRARWRSDPRFVLSIGGLHPRFPAPPDLPDLERVAISLTSGDNPRLRLDAYLALTSNTAQIGALLELHVAGSGFSLDGALQFDALLTFSPFGFVVDLAGGVTVSWHGHTLAGVALQLTLSGPAPVAAHGSATFSIWRFSHSIDVDLTLGAGRALPDPAPVDPLPDLVASIRDPRTWTTAPPQRPVVTLREAHDAGGVLLHPAGVLEVRQGVVPLDTTITRFGRRPLSGGPRRFTVSAALGDGTAGDGVATVRDHFAPARFFDLSDAERLSRPSFERLPSGMRLAPGGVATADAALTATTDLGYHTRIVDHVDGAVRDGAPHHPGSVEELTRRRDVGQAPGPRRRIGVDGPTYVLARADDLTVEHRATPAGEPLTYTEAAEVLGRERARDPGRARGLRVVPRHVAVGAVFAPQRPGEAPQQPGEYLEHDPSGEPVPDPRQVTMEPWDDPLPPTGAPGRVWLWIGPPETAGSS